ncbi:TMV resistance protein N [Senna tora]|uniref:TMV resistance protein N n=1 Tax=Senna tora TaxID=362788 RepID=A0A834XGI9_9FABA|nr:TMV resistance protein N [Senna tora]
MAIRQVTTLPGWEVGSETGSSSLTSQVRSVRVKCQSEFHVRQHMNIIFNAFGATICADLETGPRASRLSDMGTSALSNCHNQVQVLGSDSLLSSLSIHIGKHIRAQDERILQNSTTNQDGDCSLAGNKHPDRLMFKGEGSSVLFKMPQVIGSSLKAMTLHIVYSSSLANMASIHLRSVLIVNHTKATIQIHKKEALISPSVEEWKDMISDLKPGDKVEIVVIFGDGFNVKKTTLCLIYNESVDEKTECSSAHSNKAIDSSEEEKTYTNPPESSSKRCLDKQEDESFEKGKKKMKM